MRTTLVPDPADQPTMTIEEVLPILGISRAAAYRAAAAGDIPTLRIGRSIRVPTAALRQLLGMANDVEVA